MTSALLSNELGTSETGFGTVETGRLFTTLPRTFCCLTRGRQALAALRARDDKWANGLFFLGR